MVNGMTNSGLSVGFIVLASVADVATTAFDVSPWITIPVICLGMLLAGVVLAARGGRPWNQ